MNIAYRLIGTKETKKIYVRLWHNKLTLPVSTNLVSREIDWDESLELFKKNNAVNKKLIELKINIETAFNTDYCSGVIINTQWLKNIIKTTFERPTGEKKMVNHENTIFMYNFGFNWVKTDVKAELLTNKEKSQILKALEQFNNFQQKEKTRIKLVDFDTQKIKDFYDFLIGEKYASASAKKILGEIKFLCQKAEELKINVCLDHKTKISFKDKSEKIDSIYLNEKEIDLIYKHDFSDSELLDIIRDNFILNLWTGLRISDLKNLDSSNFIDGHIEYTSQKTNTLAVLPKHPHVKAILTKRFGNLPPKINKDEYNIQIKEVCRICGIDAPTKGKLFDPKKKRKIAGTYPKYKLVSSHTARRSFATNLSEVLTVSEIAKVGGWNKEDMAVHYNKKNKFEITEKLDNIWNLK
jgi:integrase